MIDKTAWGYILAVVIVIGAFVGLITKTLSEAGFTATLGVAVGVAAGTSALRATTASTSDRVNKVTGTGDGGQKP